MNTAAHQDCGSRFVPWDIKVARINFGANCGPIAFATATEHEVCRVMQFFTHFEEKPWTTLTHMRTAFAMAGFEPETLRQAWPERGVALIQWLGPWSQRDFFSRWSLFHTHWIAVDGDWVFDHTELCWMKKQEWEREVAPLFLQETRHATGWAVKYGVTSKRSIWSESNACSGVSTGDTFNFSG